MEFVNDIWAYLEPIWAWLMTGLENSRHGDGASINWVMLGVQMGIIAIVMALLMPSFGAILIFTVASVIVHVVVDEVYPLVTQQGAEFQMPPVTDLIYWQYLAFAGLAYFVALAVLSIIKAILLPR